MDSRLVKHEGYSDEVEGAFPGLPLSSFTRKRPWTEGPDFVSPYLPPIEVKAWKRYKKKFYRKLIRKQIEVKFEGYEGGIVYGPDMPKRFRIALRAKRIIIVPHYKSIERRQLGILSAMAYLGSKEALEILYSTYWKNRDRLSIKRPTIHTTRSTNRLIILGLKYQPMVTGPPKIGGVSHLAKR